MSANFFRPRQTCVIPGSLSLFLARNPPIIAIHRTHWFIVGGTFGTGLFLLCIAYSIFHSSSFMNRQHDAWGEMRETNVSQNILHATMLMTDKYLINLFEVFNRQSSTFSPDFKTLWRTSMRHRRQYHDIFSRAWSNVSIEIFVSNIQSMGDVSLGHFFLTRILQIMTACKVLFYWDDSEVG